MTGVWSKVTCDGSLGISLGPNLHLLLPPHVTQQVGSGGAVASTPGQHVVDGLGVLAQVQQTTHDQVVHVLRTHLARYTTIKPYKPSLFPFRSINYKIKQKRAK